jgi:hypothetical protein
MLTYKLAKSAGHEIYKLAITQNVGNKLESFGLSKFRSFINKALIDEEEQNNIQHLLDSRGMIFFFKKENDYFGAGEDSRVIFARIKNPDDESPDGWAEEASFTADNLTKMMQGEPCQRVFDKDDMKGIKVVDREKIIDELKDVTHKTGEPMGTIKVIKLSRLMFPNLDRDEAPNFTRADED